MTMQTQEYLGRGPKKRKAKWIEIRNHYDPLIDGLTLGGNVTLGASERWLSTMKPGSPVVLGGEVVSVESHSNGITMVSYPVSRTIRTKSGDEADITSERIRRISSRTIVSLDLPRVITPSKGVATRDNKETKPTKTTQVGAKSQSGLDADAKAMVESLLLAGGKKYSEIHVLVMAGVPGWHRSISWVSNIAYYMRKNGKLNSD